MSVSEAAGHSAEQAEPTAARAVRICSQISRGSAVVAGALALVALVGWGLDSRLLAGISPRFPRLAPNSAVALILASFSLLALQRRDAGRARRRAGQVAAVLVGLIGLSALVEVLGAVDLGIDRLLVPAGACHDDLPCGRPSSNAGFALVLLAGSLLLIDVELERGRRPSQLLAAIVGFSSLAALAGYVYGAPPMYRFPGDGPATGLSVHATVALTALAVGVLCARPREGAMRIVVSSRAGGAVARRFLGAALVAPLIGLVFTLGEEAGVYSPPIAASLISVTTMVIAIAWVLRTARKLDASEDVLHGIERRQRAFIENATDAIFIADVTGHFVDVNPAACALVGWSREELLRLAVSDLTPPEQLAALAEARERLLRGGVERGEWSLVTKRGELVPVELTACITPEGQWQATIRDIRERKRIEEIEDDHLHRLAVVSEASLVFSQALAEIPVTGFEAVLRAIAEEARVATCADAASLAIEPDAASATAPVSIAVGTRDTIAHGLTASIRIGDRELGVLGVAKAMGTTPFAIEDGTMLNALASRAALAIEAARSYARETRGRARLQGLLDNLPGGVAFVDADGGEPVHNRFLDAFVDGRDIARDDHPLQRALRTRERIVQRMPLQRRDGTFVTMLVTAAPLPTPAERPAGAVAIFQDITAIEELERFREDWNTIVAHELRQPLNSIGLSVQLLERGAVSPEDAAEAVKRIRAAARRLDRMLEDLSDVSRLDASRMRLAPRPVHLAGLVRDLVERSGEDVRVTETGAIRPMIELDPMRLDQVLANLLSNAAKYRRRGTPIDVAIAWGDDDVRVSVTNENAGAPISDEEADRIFDRFVRSEASLQSGLPGLGVGLYITRRLVEAHGGTITLDRGVAGRTSFHVTLPLEAAARAKSGLRLVEPVPAARSGR